MCRVFVKGGPKWKLVGKPPASAYPVIAPAFYLVTTNRSLIVRFGTTESVHES